MTPGRRRLRVGIAVPDLSAFEKLNPAFGVGDQLVHAEAVLEGWKRRGELAPVAEELALVPRGFSVIDTDEKRAAADAFASDGVVAVIGARDFTYGAVRLAESHGIPVIDVNAVPSSVLERTAPWMFTLRAAQDVLYRSFVGWAHRRGLFDGRAIGVFSDRFTSESAAQAVAALTSLGHAVATSVDSDGAGVGSDRDRHAAERFQADGVDVVIPFVSGSSLIDFLEACVEIGYRPRIVDLETGEHTTDITAHLLPSALYDGTRALAMSRVGEIPAGREMASESRQALEDYAMYTGRRLDPVAAATSGEVSNLLLVSDLVRLLLHGMRPITGEVTGETIVRGLEQIRDLPLASGGNASFGRGEHWAIRQAREVEWDARRRWWVARGEFQELDQLIADRPNTSRTSGS